MLSLFSQTTSVGLVLTDEYLYGVEVALGRGEEYRFLRRGRVATPRGACTNGTVTDPELLSHALRELWRSIGFNGKRVILGLPTAICSWRRMDMPPVSREEQRIIAQNELEHEGLFVPGVHVLDLIPLGLPPGEDGVPTSIVLAEEQRIEGLRDACHRAGLVLEAAEPIAISAFRIATLAIGKDEVAAVALVSPGLAEFGIIQGGSVRYHRRIAGDWYAILGGAAAEDNVALSGAAQEENAQALLVEVRRSLAFCQRLAPEMPRPERVFLLTDEPELAAFLTVTTSITSPLLCGLLELLVLPRLPVIVQEQLAGRAVSNYLLALGLALRRKPGPADEARLDLAQRDERLLLARGADEIRLRAAVVAGVWLITNLVLWFAVQRVADQNYQTLDKLKANMAATMDAQDPIKKRQRAAEQTVEDSNKVEVWPEEWLHLLGSIITPDVQVTLLRLSQGAVQMEALCTSLEAVPRFSQALEDHLPLAEPNTDTSVDEEGRAAFKLRAKLRHPLHFRTIETVSTFPRRPYQTGGRTSETPKDARAATR